MTFSRRVSVMLCKETHHRILTEFPHWAVKYEINWEPLVSDGSGFVHCLVTASSPHKTAAKQVSTLVYEEISSRE